MRYLDHRINLSQQKDSSCNVSGLEDSIGQPRGESDLVESFQEGEEEDDEGIAGEELEEERRIATSDSAGVQSSEGAVEEDLISSFIEQNVESVCLLITYCQFLMFLFDNVLANIIYYKVYIYILSS